MGYDLQAINKDLEHFHLGSYSFLYLLEICNYVFPMDFEDGKWYGLIENKRFFPNPKHLYPAIISHNGFLVTKEETKMMAWMIKNYVALQNSMEEDKKIRSDWLEMFAELIVWMEKSNGFKIW